MIDGMSSKVLYRQLVKNLLSYPSKNKFGIYLEMKQVFRDNRHLTDQAEIDKAVKQARIGLAHIYMYIEKAQEFDELHYTTKKEYETMNPKDENFIYF